MTALLYAAVAAITAALGLTAFLGNRDDPSRQAYLGLSVAVACAYGAFALSLLPGLEGARVLYAFAGAWTPAALLWTIDRTFIRGEPTITSHTRFVNLGVIVLAPVCTLLQLALTGGYPTATAPLFVLGAFTFYGFAVALHQLWQAQERTPLKMDRSRLRSLFAILFGAILFSVFEQLGRTFSPAVDLTSLTMASRGVLLQGFLPPVSAVFTGFFMYFLYHWVVLSRLLKLSELLTRLATMFLLGVALVAIDSLTFLWIDTFTTYPLHSLFQLLIASLAFLAAYDPLQRFFQKLAQRAFDKRGARLTEGLDSLEDQLSSVFSPNEMAQLMIDAMHSTGRAKSCSVYLWDERREAYLRAGFRGEGAPIQRITEGTFADRFTHGAPWAHRANLQRRALRDTKIQTILEQLDAMNADLSVAFVSSGTVLGWLNLTDTTEEGYAADEVVRISNVAQRSAAVLTNLRAFQALEEQKRLASLGEMAAGLAHEIRNPLAGLKGAAQVLEDEPMSEDAQEMLGVIVEETDRLNRVVQQFLSYARPFELHTEATNLFDIVRRTVNLLQAEGAFDTIEILTDDGPGLPLMQVDSQRLLQVMVNLAQNACQAMSGVGVLSLSTRRALYHSQHVAELIVTDTGPGIATEVLERLFVPFFTTKHGGTGLGLAICQRIIAAHDGELDVQTTSSGATFTIRLPISDDWEQSVTTDKV